MRELVPGIAIELPFPVNKDVAGAAARAADHERTSVHQRFRVPGGWVAQAVHEHIVALGRVVPGGADSHHPVIRHPLDHRSLNALVLAPIARVVGLELTVPAGGHLCRIGDVGLNAVRPAKRRKRAGENRSEQIIRRDQITGGPRTAPRREPLIGAPVGRTREAVVHLEP